jgi:hypothetical protein
MYIIVLAGLWPTLELEDDLKICNLGKGKSLKANKINFVYQHNHSEKHLYQTALKLSCNLKGFIFRNDYSTPNHVHKSIYDKHIL